MAYQFPWDVEKLVQEQMAKGDYRSEDDVLRDALRALGAQRSLVIEEEPAVTEGIRRGLADMQAGRSQPFDEFDSEFRRRRNLSDDV